MVYTRRVALQATGVATLAFLAGCTAIESLTSGESPDEYHLEVMTHPQSLVESALFEPSDGEPFGEPAETALEAVLPEGEHTTVGFKPVPENAYVEHEGAYFQIKYVVAGRETVDRDLISVESVADEDKPEDPIEVDTLPDVDERVLTLLHTHTLFDGESIMADELRGDAYVLGLPAERDGQLASGDLDGEIVTMTDSQSFAYRIHRTTTELDEPRYTALAVSVADAESTFRETLLSTEIDAELESSDLETGVRDVLEEAIESGSYLEETPLSESFESLLDRLGPVGEGIEGTNNQLWYDDALYRYTLHVDAA